MAHQTSKRKWAGYYPIVRLIMQVAFSHRTGSLLDSYQRRAQLSANYRRDRCAVISLSCGSTIISTPHSMASSSIDEQELPGATSDLVSLNNDVLVLIFRHSGSKDLFSLMSTCRHLLREGLPILLGRDIRIRHASTLLSFHQFLVLTAPAGFEALRRLRITTKLPPSANSTHAFSEAVGEILKQAVHLQLLSLNVTALIDSDNPVLPVGSLTRLHTLILHGSVSLERPLKNFTLPGLNPQVLIVSCPSSISSPHDWDVFSAHGDILPVLRHFLQNA